VATAQRALPVVDGLDEILGEIEARQRRGLSSPALDTV
jgi:hypothetical protein